MMVSKDVHSALQGGSAGSGFASDGEALQLSSTSPEGPSPRQEGVRSELKYLCVNDFLTTELHARALRSALDFGLIDRLLGEGAWEQGRLMEACGLNPIGFRLLIDLLEANGVVENQDGPISLSSAFRAALEFRDLLESRIAFADLVWPDIHGLFPELLNNPSDFMARSRTFDLFRYDRCVTLTPQNLAATRIWTTFTTCLTRYEADVALTEVDFAPVRDFVDMGGNTGEFALRVCRRHPHIRATVVDLPVVCAIGREHVAAHSRPGEGDRISFFPADMRTMALPPPADLVSFKSILHDWPDGEAVKLITRAATIVRPGGQILIFERAPIEARGRAITYAMAPDLVFLHYLRPEGLYLQTLAGLGFEIVTHRRLELDLGFHLIVARRPA